MKNSLFFFFFLILSSSLSAQDIDIYSKKKNSNYELPKLNSQTSFEEFQLLNRNLRLQDMAFAAVVPGYVHFKVKDPAVGFALVGLRSAGYAGLAYVIYEDAFALQDLINNSPPQNTSDLSEFNTQKGITYISLGIIVTTYLFDWIHGKHRLEKKQEMIRYKYGLKLNMSYTPSPINPNVTIPTVGLHYSF
jgi:hypothetical protein